jgi:hypothetical protein
VEEQVKIFFSNFSGRFAELFSAQLISRTNGASFSLSNMSQDFWKG